MWTIRNHETGEIVSIFRDVCTTHPSWVHEQCGTSNEVELQAMLDQMTQSDYADGSRDPLGIGFTSFTNDQD